MLERLTKPLVNFFNPKRQKRSVSTSSLSSPSEALLNLFGIPTGDGYITYSWSKFAEYYYKRNPVVFACIQRLSEGCKAVDLVLKYKGEDDIPPKFKPIQDLIERPNKDNAIKQFVGLWCTQLHIAGVTYIYQNAVDSTEMRVNTAGSLHLVRPDRVKILHDKYEITGYLVDNKQELEPEQMLMTRFPDPSDDYAGMPPLLPAAVTIESYSGGENLLRTVLLNGGVPPGILELLGQQQTSEDEIENWFVKFGKRWRKAAKANIPLPLVGEGAKFHRMGQTLGELEMSDVKMQMLREICNVLAVPSQLLGDPDTSKFSNFKEANRSFFTDTVLPKMNLFVTELNEWRIKPFIDKDLEIALDTSEIEVLRQDKTARTERLSKSTWMTTNEKREESELDEYSGGDTIFMPFNLVPLESITESEMSDRSTRSAIPDDEVGPNTNKMSRYPTEAERRTLSQHQDKLLLPREKKYQKDYVNYLKGQRDRLLKALEDEMRSVESRDVPSKFVDSLFDSLDEDELLTEAVTGVQVETLVIFGQDAIDDLKVKGLIFDIERPAMERFIAKDLPRRSKLINDTMARELQNIINKGVDKGESVLKIRDRILEKYQDMSVGRARTIAQTETGHAAGAAKLEGYKQTDIELIMEWVTARDADVRDAHQYMDGATTPLGESFDTPSGSTDTVPPNTGDPAFDINCRCVMVALKPGEVKI